MKLSEAIRAGAKIRPQQARGALYEENHRITWRCLIGRCVVEKASCALGAAFEAADCPTVTRVVPKGHTTSPFRGEGHQLEADTTISYVQHPEEWNAVYWYQTTCPQCDKSGDVNTLIPHLNDDHEWTREEIALFVERTETTVRAERAEREVHWQHHLIRLQSSPARSPSQAIAPVEDVLEASEIG